MAEYTLYQVLGVGNDADLDTIKRAFRKIALASHPDRGEEEDVKFKQAVAAYSVLSDDEKRATYDEAGAFPMVQDDWYKMANFWVSPPIHSASNTTTAGADNQSTGHGETFRMWTMGSDGTWTSQEINRADAPDINNYVFWESVSENNRAYAVHVGHQIAKEHRREEQEAIEGEYATLAFEKGKLASINKATSNTSEPAFSKAELIDEDLGKAFIVAVCNGNTDALAIMLNANPDIIDYIDNNGINGWTALHWAAREANDVIMNMLIDHIVQHRPANYDEYINAREPEMNTTPLHIVNNRDDWFFDDDASQKLPGTPERTKTAILLVAFGGNIDAISSEGVKPLHYAASAGKIGVMQVCKAAGADINEIDGDGNSPEFYAKRYADGEGGDLGDQRVVEALHSPKMTFGSKRTRSIGAQKTIEPNL